MVNYFQVFHYNSTDLRYLNQSDSSLFAPSVKFFIDSTWRYRLIKKRKRRKKRAFLTWISCRKKIIYTHIYIYSHFYIYILIFIYIYLKSYIFFSFLEGRCRKKALGSFTKIISVFNELEINQLLLSRQTAGVLGSLRFGDISTVWNVAVNHRPEWYYTFFLPFFPELFNRAV